MLLFLIKNTSIERFRAARRQGENMGNAMVALKTADEVKAALKDSEPHGGKGRIWVTQWSR
ncbi:hypothetical protein KAM622c_07620 [Klebsiella quasipneumoniae subsp. quasipneumoniae]|nr:hypothetical protein KAM622c_07620 [Klebsiella quasipneumoniae subsp. quasipneumoniae]